MPKVASKTVITSPVDSPADSAKRQLFGTDGVRGKANTYPMTAEVALRLAMATAMQFKRGNHRHKVVIGKDTRLSCYMLENALTAGFTSAGMDVLLVGPVPTPAIAMLTKSLRCDLGVMISASHNPYFDNGLKFFAPDGYKLSDETEMAIESRLASGKLDDCLVSPEAMGRATRIEDASGRYIEFVKQSVPSGISFEGLRVVLDCANGAAYKVAPMVLTELGAEVISVGVSPNGFNINENSGALHPESMQAAVLQNKADLGIALDGDADRLILCDERGERVDGDQILALIARNAVASRTIKGGGVVATVMSNMGLERFIQSLDLDFVRTPVGDRYVVEGMRHRGCNIGGEQSGHIVLSDCTTTGDGLLAACQVLMVMKTQNKPASLVARPFTPFPQRLENIRFEVGAENPLDKAVVKAAIISAERRLGAKGRVLVRRSGTESLIRVMVECEDETLLNDVMAGLLAAIVDG